MRGSDKIRSFDIKKKFRRYRMGLPLPRNKDIGIKLRTMAEAKSHPAHLDPSELGTKE